MTEELKEITKVPGPEEWARHNDDIDARNVHAFWFGKSLDEVQKYFGGGQSIQRGDELLFMPRRARASSGPICAFRLRSRSSCRRLTRRNRGD